MHDHAWQNELECRSPYGLKRGFFGSQPSKNVSPPASTIEPQYRPMWATARSDRPAWMKASQSCARVRREGMVSLVRERTGETARADERRGKESAHVVVRVGRVGDDRVAGLVRPPESLGRLGLVRREAGEDGPGVARPADLLVGAADEDLAVGVEEGLARAGRHLGREVGEGEGRGGRGGLERRRWQVEQGRELGQSPERKHENGVDRA